MLHRARALVPAHPWTGPARRRGALELGRGMNVLTGETGAGKSIIVDALALLRGARGRADLVRQGAESARVEAQFELDAAGAGAHRAGTGRARGRRRRGAGARARGRASGARALGGAVDPDDAGRARAGRRAADRHLQSARAPLADARRAAPRSAGLVRRARGGCRPLRGGLREVAGGAGGRGGPAPARGRGRGPGRVPALPDRGARAHRPPAGRAGGRCARASPCCATANAGRRSPARPTTRCTRRTMRSPGDWRRCSTRPAAAPTARRCWREIQEQLGGGAGRLRGGGRGGVALRQ